MLIRDRGAVHFRFGLLPGRPAAWGWIVHYAIGIVFAALLIALWGLEWVRNPTLGPALIVGVGTVVIPFFIMQPAFGIGIAGIRTPNPGITQVKSLAAHASFAIGLFLAANAWALIVGVKDTCRLRYGWRSSRPTLSSQPRTLFLRR